MAYARLLFAAFGLMAVTSEPVELGTFTSAYMYIIQVSL